jgi:citrate lyase subunit beta/citryl-CoA lyase
MGTRPTIEAMRAPAFNVALVARAHGLAAWGVTGKIAEFNDLDAFSQMAIASRDAGFTGALAIHPRQVPVLNKAFGVDANEAAEASAIVRAFDEAERLGLGAVAHNGKMLDLPIVERARAVLRRAERGAR